MEKTGFSLQTGQPTGGFVGGQTMASYGRDAMGRVLTYIEYSAQDGTFVYERDATYNVKSQITDDTVTTMYADDVRRYVTVSHYDYQAETFTGSGSFTGAYLGGAVTHVSATKTIYDTFGGSTSGGSSDTRNTYQWWDAAQQSATTLKPDATHTNTSTYYYDDSGHLTSVYINDTQSQRNRTVTFVNDAAGLVLERKEQDNLSTGDPRELHYYFNEAQVPVAALFEAGKARLAGRLPALDDELAGITAHGGYAGSRSPGRGDAPVRVMTELARRRAEPRVRVL